MQLNRKKSIRKALTTLSAVLIGSGIASAADGNKLESSLLLYSETDRVQAAEGIVSYSHALSGDRTLSGRLSFDALTGPSPNGAAPSSGIQTFTRPSGQGSYSVAGGVTPLDDTFRDSRISFDGSYSQPLGRLTTLNLGGHFSTEHDYTSLGANIGFSHDLNRRNTTLAFSTAFSHDLVRPEGGAPVPLSMLGAGGEDEREIEIEDEFEDDDRNEGSDDSQGKDVLDVVFGVTQVLNRSTLIRMNYSFNHASGYLNDPYKIVSRVQDRTDDNPGEPTGYIFEARPDNRTKHALYGALRKYVGGHTIDFSYRYFWDDWGTNSHTFDFRYRLPVGSGHAVQPHVRWYRQTEADFYRAYLLDSAPIPTHASADYRLAPFHAITLGLQYFLPVAPRTQLSLGAEYYYQAGDISPPEGMGPLSQYDLFPEMKAIMVRAGFSYDF